MHKAFFCGISSARSSLLPLLIPCLAVCSLLVLTSGRLAMAQEQPRDEADAADGEAPSEAPAERSAGETPPPAESQSVLSMGLHALGWTYSLIFLSISFTLVALCVMGALAARRENVLPSQLIAQFESNLNEKRYQEAYDVARADGSFLGRVLSAGLAKLSTTGYSQAIEAMQEVGEDENMKLDHQLSYVAMIAAISPMVGLFGTVHGMIMSFQVIASSTTAPSPQKLAEGIMTALWTTLVGLFIAIPAIAAYTILRNRVTRLVLEVGIVSEGLMSRFQTISVRKPPAAPTAQPPQQVPIAQTSTQQQMP